MTTTTEPLNAAQQIWNELAGDHVVICLGSFSQFNGQPQFMVKVYGTFTADEVAAKSAEIQRLEGGVCLIRPLTSWADTVARISAD